MKDVRPAIVLIVLALIAIALFLAFRGDDHEKTELAGAVIDDTPVAEPIPQVEEEQPTAPTEPSSDAEPQVEEVASDQPLNFGAVSGFVLDAHTGQPVAGVPIITARSIGAEKSGEDGAFRVTGFPAGTYTIDVAAPAYLASEPIEFTVLEDEETTGVIVRVTAGGIIEGRVTRGGRPQAGAKVEVIPIPRDAESFTRVILILISVQVKTNNPWPGSKAA
ncbi:MAG: carboxypeptidase-like regulatory domain-containing protein [Candidatus Hydrogenedentota bacterium]